MLFVAGEASGDRIVSSVLAELGRPAFGWGGAAAEAAGGELIADLRATTAMGALDVATKTLGLARAVASLAREARRRKPRAALLVDFTELNARLGPWLRSRGVRVLWCVAPQVWAWRAHRTTTMRRAMDRLAVLFSFETALWRASGVDAHWVGHPALEGALATRDEARAALGIATSERALAILPGSRPRETRRLLARMLEATRSIDVARVVLLARSLDEATTEHARELAARSGARVIRVDPSRGLAPHLRAFDAALVCSGTATLECALAGVPPVVAYRLDPFAAWLARRAIRTPHVALPNVLLGRRAFPELLQDDATPLALARALTTTLDDGPTRALALADELRALLDVGDRLSFGARVARLVTPWL